MSLTYPPIVEVRQTVNDIIRNYESEDLEQVIDDDLQQRFVEIVESTNARLRRCDELLTSGLRSEAIQEAEREPNIFDLVAELDFAEWDAWKSQVRLAGLNPQPDLLVDIAAELNEAYSLHVPVENLLRKHRVYALARAPLADRITVLRSIAKRDADNDLWRKDLRSYEKARFGEIEKELRNAFAKKDFSKIDDLRNELNDDQWLLKIPDPLRKTTEDNYRLLVSADSLRKLEGLAEKIYASFSAFDVKTTMALQKQWNKHVSRVRDGSKKLELEDSVQSAFEWLEDEIVGEEEKLAQQTAYNQLDAAIDDPGVTKAELQRTMGVCDRFEDPVPDKVERRYEQRIRALELKEKRKTFITVFSIVSLIVVLAGIGIGLFLWQAARAQLAENVNTLERLLNESKLTEANGFLEKLEIENPQISDVPEVGTLKLRLQEMQKIESERLLAFEGALSEAEDVLTESADDGNLESVAKNRFVSALDGLAQAEGIAIGELEQVQLKELERKIKVRLSEYQNVIDKKFASEVAGLKNAIAGNQLQSLGKTEVAKLIQSADAIKLRHREVSSATFRASQLDLIRRRLVDRQKAIAESKQLSEAMSKIRNAVGDAMRYKAALNSYVILDKDSSRSADFKTVLAGNLSQTFDLPASWNRLADNWNVGPESLSDMQRVELVERMERDFSLVLETTQIVSKQKDHFISASKSGAKQKLESIKKRLKGLEFQLSYFEDRNERKYYFKKLPSETSSGYTFEVHNQLRNITATKKEHENQSRLKKLGASYFADSPQKVFAESAIQYLDKNESASFESKIIYLLDELVANHDAMDPILRTKLILQFTGVGRSGSKYLNSELEKFESDLSERTVGARTANYLDPEDKNANVVRGKCEPEFRNSKLTSPKESFEKNVVPILDAMKPPTLQHYCSLGIAVKEASRFTVLFDPDFKKELTGSVFAELPTLAATATKSKRILSKVGTFENGELNLQNGVGVIEGLPLLLQHKATEASNE